MRERGNLVDRLKTIGRSTVLFEVAPGKWKKVIGPVALILTLPFGGKIKLGFDDVEICGANTIGSGKCDVEGGAGHYDLNGFDLDKAFLVDI